MEVNDEQKMAGTVQQPDGEPEPSQPPVIEPDPTVPAEEPPGPNERPEAPVEDPPEDPGEEDAPVEEPPDRHEQDTPIEEPPGGPGPMEVAAAEPEAAVDADPEVAAADPEAAAADPEVVAAADPEAAAADPEAVAADPEVVAADPEAAAAAEPEAAADSVTPDDPEIHAVMSAEEVMGGQSTEQASEAAVDEANLRAVVEAIVYVTEEPLTLDQIAAALEQSRERVAEALRQIIDAATDSGRGITVREVAGGFKMGTKPEHHDAIRSFVKKLKPPLKLSLAALETLAVIAYKQPITAPEIMEVRGVQGAGVIKTLLDRKLIQPAGRKAVVGKPILYKTTKEFLLQFGLKDLSELPTLKEFEELRRLAFSDDEPIAEPVQPDTPPVQAAAAE